jgi:uncharacterized membrane protein
VFSHVTVGSYEESVCQRGLNWKGAGDMKAIYIIGIILIILGAIALANQAITYTKSEKEIALGPVDLAVKEKESIPLSPILGGSAVAGGIVLTIIGYKTKKTQDK